MGVSTGGPLARVAVVSIVSVCAACGGGGDGGRALTQPTAGAPGSQWTLKGRVVETLTDTPVAGATLAFALAAGTREVASAADGSWEISPANGDSAPYVEVSAPGYVTRRTYLRWTAAPRDDLLIDLIKESEPFSLSYYRELVRNQFDEPDTLQPLRRWTSAPAFYIHRRNPVTGDDISGRELDLVIAAIRAAVPQMSGGRFEAARIEHGSDDRAERAGYITVKFVHDEGSGYCGRARVGADPGMITINYGVNGCSTPCGAFPPRTVAHEVGHAMGFWHVGEGSVLNTIWYGRDCSVTTFSTAERHHARIAYARPPGNQDADWDPVSLTTLQAPPAPPATISCR